MQPWVDGQPQATLGLSDRGLAYGDGLFETIAVASGRPLLFKRHLYRLFEGCTRLGMAVDRALIERELLGYAKAMGSGVLKLILTRGDSQRGYGADPSASPRRILQASPRPAYPQSHYDTGVRLFPCATRLAEQPLLAGLKHLNRLEQVIARNEWASAEFAEGLMLDMAGRIVEGVFSNVFLVRHNTLLTPELSRCGVAGTLRAELLDRAQEAGCRVAVTDLTLDDLAQASEVFVCNSVYGIWPVIGHGDLNWSVGPVTRKLQRIAHGLLDLT